MTRATLALVLLATAFASAAPVPKAKNATPYPMTVGTRWEYIHDGDPKKVQVEEIVEAEEKDGVITFKVDITDPTGEKRFEKYRWKDGELRLVQSSYGEHDPPTLIRKDVMKDGDVWESEGKFKSQGVEIDTKETLTVGKAEEITTPAGKFTATPIAHKQDGLVSVYWFADGVGMVRQTYDGAKEPAQELKSFTLGKDKK